MIARRVAPLYGKLVASPGYIEAHGSPETPEEFVGHQAPMQGTEAGQLIPAGVYVVRSPGQHPARKIRVLTELLIESFEQVPQPAGAGR